MIYGYVHLAKTDTRERTRWRTENLRVLGVDPANLRVSRKFGKFRQEKPAALLKQLAPGDTLAVTAVSQLAQKPGKLCRLVGLAYERKIRLVLGPVELDFSGDLKPGLDGVLDMAHLVLQLERECQDGGNEKNGQDDWETPGSSQ